MNITWQQMSLIWTIIAVSAGGAFAVCAYAHDAEVAAHELRAKELERRVQEVGKRLQICLKAQDRQFTKPANTAAEPEANYPSVLVTYPKSGAKIQMHDRVEFAVQGELPSGYVTLLVVRDPTGQWWSWGQSSNGVFPQVQFGVLRDHGESFEVRVLITDSPYPKNKPRHILPDAIASDSVIVVRR